MQYNTAIYILHICVHVHKIEKRFTVKKKRVLLTKMQNVGSNYSPVYKDHYAHVE